jgi:hypothetical protein
MKLIGNSFKFLRMRLQKSDVRAWTRSTGWGRDPLPGSFEHDDEFIYQLSNNLLRMSQPLYLFICGLFNDSLQNPTLSVLVMEEDMP